MNEDENKESRIPKDYIESFNKWSKKSGVSTEELEMRFNKILSEEPGNLKRAKKVLRIELSDEVGSLFSNAVPFYGYFIGDSGMFDWIQRMKDSAEWVIEHKSDRPDRFEDAIKRGKISPEGIPLDFRPKRFREDNPTKGVPLADIPAEYQRELFALVSPDSSFETVRIANVVASGDNAKNLRDIGLFKFYRFRANVGTKSSESNVIVLRVGAGTKFREYESKITPEEIANKISYNDIIPKIVEKEYIQKFEKKPRTTYVAIYRGDVGRMYNEPRNNTRSFYVASESDDLSIISLRCNMTVNIPIIFREAESIIILGRLWKSNRTGKYGMELKGYVPLGY